MHIVSTSGKGNFIIENNEQRILELSYENWFSSKSSTEFNEKKITIMPKNFWQSKFDIYKNGHDAGDILFNWKGNVIIRLLDSDHKESSYLLKAKGFWKRQFEFLDENENLICTLIPSLSWKNFRYSYAIEQVSTEIPQDTLVELLVYAGFGANLYMTMIASGSAAM